MVILSILLILATSLSAKPRGKHITIEKIGQKYYLNACSKCHGAGKLAGNMATINEWKALLDNNATELISLHIDVYDKEPKDAKSAIMYLKSSGFKKQKRRLLKFLQEFASDSPDIPTCY